MTLIDYPGHLVAGMLILFFAVLTFYSFYTEQVKTAERKMYRWILLSLQFLAIIILLIIIWNPSKWDSTKVYSQNSVLAIFDTSRSMSIQDDNNKTRLDNALDGFATNFRPGNPRGADYTIYGFDSQVYYCGSSDLLRRWGNETNLNSAFSILNNYNFSEEYKPVSHLVTDNPDGHSITDIQQVSQADTLAGIVIFTDGQAIDKNPQNYQYLLHSDIPVLLIGIGPKEPDTDIAVASVTAAARVWIDTVYNVTVDLEATDISDKNIALELLCNNELVGYRQIPSDQFKKTADTNTDKNIKLLEAKTQFTIPAKQLGTHILTANVKPLTNENNLANNSRSTSVDVTQEQMLNVLLYSQWANFDIGKLRQALAWDKRINLDVGFDLIKDQALANHNNQNHGYIKLPQTKEEFNRYDVIILGPCDLTQFGAEQLNNLYSFVADRGGGLMLLPGVTVASLRSIRNNKAKALLPVIIDERQDRIWPPKPEIINLTFEAEVKKLFDPEAFTTQNYTISPYYEIEQVKPAATKLATINNNPILTAHRLGRGHVCLLNTSKLYLLYQEDEQGGILSEIISGLVTYIGRTPSQGANVELFTERNSGNPKEVIFSAYVLDKEFNPVDQANVLLTVGENVISMRPIGQGRYSAQINQGYSQSVVASVQAEYNGSFIGERTIATNLPPIHDEMTTVYLDEQFLKDLADKLGAFYSHLDNIDDQVTKVFVPRQEIGTTQKISSVWPIWLLFLTLCLILSFNWFLRRAIGLV